MVNIFNVLMKFILKILKIFMTPNKIEQDEIKKEFQIINNSVKGITVSYYIFKTLFSKRNSLEMRKNQAESNLETMKYYGSFFAETELSHVINFVMRITNCFDTLFYKGKESLNIKGLINKMSYNIGDFYHLIKKHKSTLLDLRKIRNKNFAHLDPDLINRSFVILGVEELIHATQELLNNIGNHIYGSYFLDWDITKNSTIRDVEYLLSNLSKYHINLICEGIKNLGKDIT